MHAYLESVGKARRMARVLQSDRRTVIVAFDDSLISGPHGAFSAPATALREVAAADPDGILAFGGLLRAESDSLGRVATILNLTASTTRSCHSRKVPIASVEDAVKVGADAVAVHVNVGSTFEPQMLRTLGEVASRATELGLPVLAIMYPRTDGPDPNFDHLRREKPDQYAEFVAHAARIGVDLGADIVKTQFTGNPESFATVVAACAPVPVIVAGGPLANATVSLELAAAAVEGGASGISVGRNVLHRAERGDWVRAFKAIVHDGLSPGEAQRRFGVFDG